MYRYGLIDAQYILRRNAAVMKNNGFTESELRRSFLQSIKKMQREIGFMTPVLLFDKSPYKKSAAFPAYKSDRIYYTDQYLEEHKDELSEHEIEVIKSEIDFNTKVQKVKYGLVNDPGDGISYLKSGYEADDLAYILANKIANDSESINLVLKSILISVDNDWNTFTNKRVDFITPRMDLRLDVRNRWTELSKQLDIPIYELGLCNELFNHSHNNIDTYKGTTTPEGNVVTFKDFSTSMYLSEDNIPRYEEYKKYFDAMNMNQYMDDIKLKL